MSTLVSGLLSFVLNQKAVRNHRYIQGLVQETSVADSVDSVKYSYLVRKLIVSLDDPAV